MPRARERLARLTDVERGPVVSFSFDGELITSFAGETVAAALLAADRRVLRQTARTGAPRGLFCGMGVCFDCVVRVDGESLRACMVPVREGMVVTSR